MKIKFDPNQAFQKQAIDAITGVFEGQEICRTNFTVAPLQFASEPSLPGMMVESRKSIFDHVVYDSDIELEFAAAFEKSDDVKLYAKLPKWFRIDTPLGAYNPDWAVLIEADGREKLYFVVETKSTLFSDALRPAETAKIACGKAHFKSLGRCVEFAVTNAFDDFTGKYANSIHPYSPEI